MNRRMNNLKIIRNRFIILSWFWRIEEDDKRNEGVWFITLRQLVNTVHEENLSISFSQLSLSSDSAQVFQGLLLRCDLAQSVKEFSSKIITIIIIIIVIIYKHKWKHMLKIVLLFWHHVLFCTSIISFILTRRIFL